MIENLLIFILLIFATCVAHYQLKIFSFRPSVLGSYLFLTLFIQIIPGTILVSFFAFPLVLNIQSGMSQELLELTFRYTATSIACLLLMLSFCSKYIDLDINLKSVPVSKGMAIGLLIISIVVVFIKVASIGQLPIVLALKGDAIGAAMLKAKILKQETGFGGLFIGYIFMYFPYVSLIYSYICKQILPLTSKIFYINFWLMTFYCLYDLQKSKLVMVFFMLFVLYLKKARNINYFYVLITPLIGLVFLAGGFMILHETPIGEVLNAVAGRLFIGQAEGAYMMYDVLTPDFERITYGMPLAGTFGFAATDPAAEIITIFFPTAGSAWVNSNTYMQSHAWTIFGDISLIIAPLIVTMNIVGLYILKGVFSKYLHGYAHAVYIVTLLTLPLNNDFSFFLYFKSWLCFIILSVFLIVVKMPGYFIFTKKAKKKEA
ncbi:MULTISPECIES: hypothetical protein [unclassified Pseudoalteromonas]|uniref:hypothetical protein n=1 Tax=unclassified Pseudoalteromonas TaxID=194690 RepID=UPI000C080A14|nr:MULTISPECIES: hypothetical protein [unclassified Pseudoalteromonas]MDP2636863.1 hypothetical protein [Pseudoalteromonas sp. 1_MG-2023]PHN88687.1 hypothetical protein CSC79_16255 [Pseudoalteromonas sp. 3D05]